MPEETKFQINDINFNIQEFFEMLYKDDLGNGANNLFAQGMDFVRDREEEAKENKELLEKKKIVAGMK